MIGEVRRPVMLFVEGFAVRGAGGEILKSFDFRDSPAQDSAVADEWAKRFRADEVARRRLRAGGDEAVGFEE